MLEEAHHQGSPAPEVHLPARLRMVEEDEEEEEGRYAYP